MNKEISRKHAELYIESSGFVFVNSLGREPISLNGCRVTSPHQLNTGDMIEVQLEGRTRKFYYRSENPLHIERSPLVEANFTPKSSSVKANALPVSRDSEKEDEVPLDNVQPPPPPIASQSPNLVASNAATLEEVAEYIVDKEEDVKLSSLPHCLGTPEGVPVDATLPFEVVPHSVVASVVIEADSTFAFKQWAMGSMTKPASLGKGHATPAPQKLAPSAHVEQSLETTETPKLFTGFKPTPFNKENGRETGRKSVMRPPAPAPTPKTGAKLTPNHNALDKEMDAIELAEALAEIAGSERKLTPLQFSVLAPATQMGCTSKSSVAAPTSEARSAAPTSVAHAPGTSATKSRLATEGRGCTQEVEDVVNDLVAGAAVALDVKGPILGGGDFEPKVGEDEAVFMEEMDADVMASSLKALTPHSRFHTPGAKVILLESARKSSAQLSSRMAVASVATPEESCGGVSQKLAMSDLEEDGDAKVAFPEDEALGMDCTAGVDQIIEEDAVLFPTVSLADHKRMILRARAYKAETLKLASALRQMSHKAARLKKAGSALAVALEEETARRTELQEALQQIVANRAALNEEEDIMDDVLDEQDHGIKMNHGVRLNTAAVRVVVCGDVASRPEPETIEYAGDVVVVRQEVRGPVPMRGNKVCSSPPKSAMKCAQTPGTPKTSKRTPLLKSSMKSGTPLVLDDVELPVWLFSQEMKPTPEIATQLAVVAGEEEDVGGVQSGSEAKEEVIPVLSPVIAALPMGREMSPEIMAALTIPEEHVSEEEEEDEMCFVCGKGDAGDVLLLCDGCDNACHLECCNPARKKVPKGNWFCTECKPPQQEIEEKPAGLVGKRGLALEENGRRTRSRKAVAPKENDKGAPKRSRAAMSSKGEEEDAAAPKPVRASRRRTAKTS